MKIFNVKREDLRDDPTEHSLAVFFDERSVCGTMNPVFTANSNRNVPPERDVEPAILSLAELSDSIQRRGCAMQPHSRLGDLARITHVS